MSNEAPSRDRWKLGYLLDGSDVITRVTGDWSAFAQANGSQLNDEQIVGRSIWEFISGDKVRDLYHRIYTAVRRTKLGFTLPCRCDGVTEMRRIRVNIQPVGLSQSLYCTSKITSEIPRSPVRILERMTLETNQGATYCSWCNRIETPVGWVMNGEAQGALRAGTIDAAPALIPSVCERCSRLLTDSLDRLLGPIRPPPADKLSGATRSRARLA